MTKFHYILTLFLAFGLVLKAQVYVGEGVTIKNNTVIVVQDQDLIVNGDIEGDGTIVLKEDQKKNLKVVYQGKEMSNEEMAQNGIERQGSEASTNEAYASAPKEEIPQNLELVQAETLKELKAGTLILKKITKTYEAHFPFENAYASTGQLMPLEQIDNYFILNDNYKIITKERIMSSQNMHESEYVKAALDPPKA